MKKLLKTILTLSMVVMAVATFAQPQHSKKEQMTPEQMATMSSTKMATELNLTEAQKKQVYTLNLERSKARAEMRKMTPEQRQAQAAKHVEAYKKYDEQMAKILTADQLKTWREKQAQMKKHHGKKGGDNGKACSCDSGCKKECKKECSKPCGDCKSKK